MKAMSPEIIIVGAGPAGCTLAALLAQRGVRVLVFDDEKRPELLVGESLIPAVVPVFRQLGIEERMMAFCTRKPGASFFCNTGQKMHFCFESVKAYLPPYSYNTPRPALDNLLRARAEELGARFIKARAVVERCDHDGEPAVKLSAASRAQAGLAEGDSPLLIDASGRARVFARAMELPALRGKRNDIAYFAHYEGFHSDEVPDGQVIISVLTHGWSWRIPLPGRTSVGIVINKERAKELGSTPEERLANALAVEPLLRERSAQATRVTDVMSYTNYQLLTQRSHGPGWVLLGDAFGFVDPMLSPGLFMSLEGARLLDEHVFARGTGILAEPAALSQALEKFSAEVVQWHEAWTQLVEYFYNGEMFRAYVGGQQLCARRGAWHPARWLDRHANAVIAGMASGGTTRSRYSQAFLRFMCRYVVKDVPPASVFAVQD